MQIYYDVHLWFCFLETKVTTVIQFNQFHNNVFCTQCHCKLKMLIDIVNQLKGLLYLSLPVYRCISPNILLLYKMFKRNSIVKLNHSYDYSRSLVGIVHTVLSLSFTFLYACRNQNDSGTF